MKYVLTGGAGHITKPAAERLLQQGHSVTVISRNAENAKALAAKGAVIAEGSVEDGAFIEKTFSGADAVYLMIPPSFSLTGGWREYQNKIADIFVNAVKVNDLKKVVVLSSVGAHMGNGCGPVDGLADLEKKLSVIASADIHFLRPSYFFYNLFSMIPLIKNMNIMGGNYMDGKEKLVLSHTTDIADVLAEVLLSLDFKGQSVRYIASDERTTDDIANVLSSAIGKAGVPWVPFTDEQTRDGMLQAGLPETIADGYAELGKALRTGEAQADYWKNRPVLGKIKLEDFAKEFASVYHAS